MEGVGIHRAIRACNKPSCNKERERLEAELAEAKDENEKLQKRYIERSNELLEQRDELRARCERLDQGYNLFGSMIEVLMVRMTVCRQKLSDDDKSFNNRLLLSLLDVTIDKQIFNEQIAKQALEGK